MRDKSKTTDTGDHLLIDSLELKRKNPPRGGFYFDLEGALRP